MIQADLINGAIEAAGGAFNFMNVRALLKSKRLEGVSPIPTAFFTTWGLWNLYYYPHLGQWFSFYGGLFVVLTNLAWLFLAWLFHKTQPTRYVHD